MIFKTPAMRLSIALVLLTVNLLFLANLIGLVPTNPNQNHSKISRSSQPTKKSVITRLRGATYFLPHKISFSLTGSNPDHRLRKDDNITWILQYSGINSFVEMHQKRFQNERGFCWCSLRNQNPELSVSRRQCSREFHAIRMHISLQ